MSIMSSSKMKKKKKVAGCSGSSGISAEEDLAVGRYLELFWRDIQEYV